MKKMRKLMSLILCMLMVLSIFGLSMTVFANEMPVEEGNCGENAQYVLGGSHILTLMGSGKVDDYFFRGRDDIWELEIKGDIEEIGEFAFEGCENLTDIHFVNDDLKVIGQRAFAYSGLTNVTLPSCVETLGFEAFSCCPDLEEFYVSDTVTAIGKDAFYCCFGLGSITVDENNTVYDSRNDCNAIIETATNTLLTGCKSTIIPEGVDNLASGAFFNCLDLEEIVIPEGVKAISDYAFAYCLRLKKITLPESLEVVGQNVFPYCMSLEEFIIPDSVKVIAVEGFSGCISLKKLVNYSGTAAVFATGDETMYDTFSKDAPLTPQQYIDVNYFISRYYPRIDPEADTLSAEGLIALEAYTGIHFDSSEELDEALGQCVEDGFPSGLEIFCKEKSTQHDILVKYGFDHNIIAVTQGITYKDCDLKCGNHIDIYKNDDIEPSCMSVGYKGGTICLICAEKDDPERIAASVIEPAELYGEIQPHTPAVIPEIEPSCIEEGCEEIIYCSVCHELLSNVVVIPKTEHTDTDGDGVCEYCGEKFRQSEQSGESSFLSKLIEALANSINRIIALFKKIFG